MNSSKQTFLALWAAQLMAFVPASSAALAPGSLDPAFDPGLGIDQFQTVNSMALDGPGRIVIGGNFRTVHGISRPALARLRLDGSLDASFAPAVFTNANQVWNLAIATDGKIVVNASSSQTGGDIGLFRLNPDGTVDPSFRSTQKGIFRFTIQTDGKILVQRDSLLRLNADGTTDDSFKMTLNPNQKVSAHTLQKDGKIIVAIDDFFGDVKAFLRRFNSDGSSDPSLQSGTGADRFISALAVQDDGKIIATGGFRTFQGVPRPGIVRLGPDGGVDLAFQPASLANSVAPVVAVQSDGKIVLVGEFRLDPARPPNYIGRLNRDGSLDLFQPYFDIWWIPPVVQDIKIQPDGNILVAGYHAATGISRSLLTRLIGGDAAAPPQITIHPGDTTIFVRDSAELSVQATSPSAASYQWHLNGAALPGETNATLKLTDTRFVQGGEYTATVRNSFGSVTSRAAILTVNSHGPLSTWQVRHQSLEDPKAPEFNGFFGYAFGAGRHVVVGVSGPVLTSTDGKKWVRGEAGVSSELSAVVYANGRFVATGANGTIITSVDGLVWTKSVSGTSDSLPVVGSGAGLLIALSRGGSTSNLVLTSTDGAQWQRSNLPRGFSPNALIRGPVKFVAVGSGGMITSSADGSAWSEPVRAASVDLNDVTFFNGQFIAVGSAGTILASPDAITWSARTSGTRENLQSIAMGGNSLVVGGGAIGLLGNSTILLRSSDASTWLPANNASAYPITKVGYGGELFIALANGSFGFGLLSEILNSQDGMQWRNDLVPLSLTAVTAGNNRFVAVGNNGTVLESSDGRAWNERPNPSTAHLNDVAYGNGVFVAVGWNGAICSSTNGMDWAERVSGTRLRLHGVAFGGGNFAAVGGYRFDNSLGAHASELVVLSSADGANWKIQMAGTNQAAPLAVTYGNGQFMSVGAFLFRFRPGVFANFTLRSTNGVDWIRAGATLPNTYYRTVAAGNGIFVASGYGVMATSTDGVLWNPVVPAIPDSGLTFANGTFIAAAQGAVYTSTNGTVWNRRPTPVNVTFSDAAFGNGTIVLVGERGTILQSAPLDSPIVSIEDFQVSSSGFKVSIPTRLGVRYVLEMTDAIDRPLWQTAASVTGTGQVATLNGPTSSYYRFYRLRTE